MNCSLLATCVVSAWYLYKAPSSLRNVKTPHHFYCQLVDELIDNTGDSALLMNGRTIEEDTSLSQPMFDGTGIHLMQTNRKRKKKSGSVKKVSNQGRCNWCKGNVKSKFLCSECYTKKKEKDILISHWN